MQIRLLRARPRAISPQAGGIASELPTQKGRLEGGFRDNLHKEQLRLQAEIDRSIFVTHAHFETEFAGMKGVSQCVADILRARAQAFISSYRARRAREGIGRSSEGDGKLAP